MGGCAAAELASRQSTEDPFILGVFCLSYPLHWPRHFKDLHISNLNNLNLPVLFISGTKDTKCRIDLMKKTINKIGSNVRMHWVHDVDHSFKVKNSMNSEILTKVCNWTVQWVQSVFMAER